MCHYTCTVIIAGLALAGVTLTALPLAFLQDPKLVVLFSGMGIISLGVSMFFHIKAKNLSGGAKMRYFLDKKMVLLSSFLLLSAWSLSQGTLQLVQAEGPADSSSKVNKEGTVEVELTFLNLKDPKIKLEDPKIKDPKIENVLIFDLTINSMDMSLSSFQAYDFKSNVVLENDKGISTPPIDARITDWGHMGHHPRGRLIFPSTISEEPVLKSRVVRVIVKGLGGVEKRVFEWKMPRSQ
ncbi:MAG: hypothetical protein ACREQA_04375 [Candidatus Binatia bacterium]